MNRLTADKTVKYTEFRRLLTQRPLVMPAVLSFTTILICYHANSVYPALIISAALLLTGIKSERRLSCLLLCYFITALMLIILGNRITCGLDTQDGYTVFGTFECKVISVEYRADGSSLYKCRLGNGALAAVYSSEPDEAGTGDVISISGKLSEPDRPGNPGEFDYAEYLHRKGILYVVWPDSIEVTQKGNAFESLPGLAESFAFLIKSGFLDSFSGGDPDVRAYAAAVFTGDTTLLDEVTIRDFRLSNCAHLLAVSGTHFAGFLLVIPYVLRTVRIKRGLGILIYAAAAFAIGMITGWSESVARACIMSTCSFASRDRPSAMSLAVIIMLLTDPFTALGTGFQLSFASAAAILIFLPAVKEKLRSIGMGELFADLISPAFIVTVALIPFCNTTEIRIHPAIIAVQIAATLFVQVACIFVIPGFALGINTPAVFFLSLLRKTTSLGGTIVSSAGIGATSLTEVLLAVCLLVLVSFLPSCFVRRHLTGPLCLVLALSTGIGAAKLAVRPAAQVIFADVGQGDCCLILTEDKTCLIDAGVYEEGDTTVLNLLDHYGIAKVDLAFVSHWDTDHAGGIAALYARDRIRTVYAGFAGEDKDVEDFFGSIPFTQEMADDFFSGCEVVCAGDVFELSEGVSLKVLAPDKAAGGGNEDSLVMMLEAGGKSILFTGDIGMKTEEMLINACVLYDCDILKVAHHGSKYSTSEDFLLAVMPETAVISVGKNNYYGHPTAECLERLEDAGADVLRTDNDGAVIIALG